MRAVGHCSVGSYGSGHSQPRWLSRVKTQRSISRSRTYRRAVNPSMLYTEHPFMERFAASAADGFAAVEYVSPYEEAAETIAAHACF